MVEVVVAQENEMVKECQANCENFVRQSPTAYMRKMIMTESADELYHRHTEMSQQQAIYTNSGVDE